MAASRNSTARPVGECLVLVGPEGRGKDVLVASARRRFAADACLVFPQRIATRSPGDNDEHLAVSRGAFRDFEMRGAFFAAWEAHGHRYALPGATEQAIAGGCIVVFAACEEAVAGLALRGVPVRVLEIAAGPDRMRARAVASALRLSGRLTDSAFASRAHLHHGGDIAAAVRAFHAMILDLKRQRLAALLPQQPGACRAADRTRFARPPRRPAKSFAQGAEPR